MSRIVVFLFLIYIASAVPSPPSVTKIYRADYVYNKKTDAFYKLHVENRNHLDAGKQCTQEGAALMVPSSHMDIVQLHGMLKRFPDIGNYVWVAEDGLEHMSAEEPAIIDLAPREEENTAPWFRQCDVVSRKGEIETITCHQLLPFICKVSAKDAPYSSTCGAYGKDYKCYQNVSSCYKIPNYPGTWNEAYAECKAQNAHLVVLNSEAEHDAVLDLMQTTPKVVSSQAWWFFFAGYRAEVQTDGSGKVFKTIFNETLENAGFSVWAPNEPNNALNSEDCGSLFKNDGNLNDVDCSRLFGFICEKEI